MQKKKSKICTICFIHGQTVHYYLIYPCRRRDRIQCQPSNQRTCVAWCSGSPSSCGGADPKEEKERNLRNWKKIDGKLLIMGHRVIFCLFFPQEIKFSGALCTQMGTCNFFFGAQGHRKKFCEGASKFLDSHWPNGTNSDKGTQLQGTRGLSFNWLICNLYQTIMDSSL